MRKITRCVIDMETYKVIEEEYYYSNEPVAECKGGGGGASGKVGFPDYMETLHSAWLDTAGADTLTLTMVDAMNAAQGNSPWTLLEAYDPDTDITEWEAAVANFRAVLTAMDDTADWAALYAQADTTIDTALEADIVQGISDFSDQLDDDIESKVLPRFRRGMQDINAVVSSAFPIGAALIEAYRDRDVARHSSEIRLALMSEKAKLNTAGTEQMLKSTSQRYGLEESYVKLMVEAMRIKIVAKSEQAATDAKIDLDDALWDLEMFQYGSNLLAAIGSGVVKPRGGPTTMQSVLGGAISGIAAGAQIGGAPGAAVGGILGAASGLL